VIAGHKNSLNEFACRRVKPIERRTHMKPLVYLLFGAALWAGEARYARLGEFHGQADVQLGPADAWLPAERNLPLVEGAWLRTAPDARLEIELDDGGAWRLGPDSLGKISDYTRLSTGQSIILLTLDYGRAYFTGGAEGDDSLVLAVPGAQVGLQHAARVRVDVEAGASQISVLEGTVRFSSPAAELDLSSGQTARVEPANPGRFFLDRDVLAVDEDTWNAERDKALASTNSALHVNESYGLLDLDAAGEWIHIAELGPVWKPKVNGSWAPFQNGRWRWYASLGFTWVSGDPWGWLPYHYGRWTHHGELGWLWVPSISQVFKPGEVYWLRGAKFVAWGPLAPGEPYPPDEPDLVPEQFFDAYTTYAAFAAGASVIDPAGFAARPKEPLKLAAFCTALPSPGFEAARLDARRPVLAAGNARVQPLLAGTAYQGAYEDAPVAPPPPVETPAPVTAETPPEPPNDAGSESVPYPLLVFIQRAARKPRTTATLQSKTPAPAASTHATLTSTTPSPATPARRPSAPQPTGTRRWPPGEYALYQKALADSGDPREQLSDLETWRERYPMTEHEADRVFLYMQAYNRIAPPLPARLVDSAALLLERDPHSWFDDSDVGPAETVAVLYLVTVSAPRIPTASPSQLRTCHMAANRLLAYLPEFFEDRLRPSGVSEQSWTKARADMESAAHQALAWKTAPRTDNR
jgi:hypothetical protein